MYPDQVARIREAQLAAESLTPERAYRMRTAEIYVRQRFRFTLPNPAGDLEQGIVRWVMTGGTRPW